MDLVAGNESLVKWCLEHGALVSDGAKDEDALAGLFLHLGQHSCP